MIKLDVTVDIKDIKKRLGHLDNYAKRAAAKASKRTAYAVVTQIKKGVSSQYHIKQKDVAKTLTIKSANRIGAFYAVRSKGTHIPLSQFRFGPKRQPRMGKSGRMLPRSYWANVKKDTPKVKLDQSPKPFYFDMPKGGAGVYVRTVDAKVKKRNGIFRLLGVRKKTRKRKATAVYGPSVPQTVKNYAIMKNVERVAKETMEKRLVHEIDRVLNP